jgi:flagellar biosynthesis GTPase FlhF
MNFILENRSWMTAGSMLMIIYAVWAVIEVFSNTWFHGLQGLTLFETGEATNVDPDDLQRNNSGLVIASGAVLGALGLYAQYVYRAAPYVNASMAATAAMILEKASGERMDEEGILAKAEEVAVAAAAEVAKETAEDTVIEMLDPDADVDDVEDDETDSAEEAAEEEPSSDEDAPEAEEAAEEAAEEEAEEAAEDESHDEAEEASEDEEDETPPEEKKKF